MKGKFWIFVLQCQGSCENCWAFPTRSWKKKKKPAGKEPEALIKKNCLQEGDMNKEERKKLWWTSTKIKEAIGVLIHQRYGGTNHNRTMKPMKSESMIEAEEPETFKAEDGRTCLKIKVKVQRIKESKANEAEVMI